MAAGQRVPEGGSDGGEQVTYTIGGVPVSDIGGASGPNVMSALGRVLAIALDTPIGASGATISVSTAGGSASLTLTDFIASTLAAEGQGSAATDGVGGTSATLQVLLSLAPSGALTVSGRLNTSNDVDLYRLDGAEAGALLSVSSTLSGSGHFRLFNEAGVQLGSGSSLSRVLLPAAGAYYLGYTGFGNTVYNAVDGTATQNGFVINDYTLTLRYADPGATSLEAIVSVADSGTPTEAQVPSANTGETLTLNGNGFTSATRVVFTTFSSTFAQNGVGTREVVPTSVAADGLSLTVVVPHDAVTGTVRLADKRAGLVLQIVPTLIDVDLTSGDYDDGSSVQLTGSGFIEAAQTVLIGGEAVPDLWHFTGPDVFQGSVGGQTRENALISLTLPASPATGPMQVRTLGGSWSRSSSASAASRRARRPRAARRRTRRSPRPTYARRSRCSAPASTSAPR